MKRTFLMVVLGVIASGIACAQEYKVSKSSGTLDIREVNDVSVEGYDGNEIIFTARGNDRSNDERAQGLRAISSMGLEDNTGLGLSVMDKGQVIEVRQLKKMGGPDVTVKVPKGVKVFYSHNSPHGSEVQFKNVEGEIEVSIVHSGVRLTNVTGPMEIKTVHGGIEAVLGAALKGPILIQSVHGHVDVALPLATKANLKLASSHGEILVDPDFKIEIERTGDLVRYSDKVSGKINGGGISIALSNSHDNVYLRKIK